MELSAALEAAGCDALLVLVESSRDPALASFVGPVHLGASLLIAGRDEVPLLAPFTDMEREEAARSGCRVLDAESLDLSASPGLGLRGGGLWAPAAVAALSAAGKVPPGRLALAGHASAGAAVEVARTLRDGGWEVADGGDLVVRVRKRKDEGTLQGVRRSAEGVCAAFRATARTLAAAAVDGEGRLWLGGERLRAGHLRDAVARALVPWGLEQPEGNIVAAGRDAAIPHNQGDSGRELAAGEALVVDLFPKGELFADCTRTFCVGEAPEKLRDAHALVLDVLHDAHRGARPGGRAWHLQEAACAHFREAGRPTPIHDEGTRHGYVHNLGHGVGYELHELPSFARTAEEDGVLEPGDVFTLEPGLYEPEEGWGVRVEDLVVMGEERVESLTPLPYAMDPREWGEE